MERPKVEEVVREFVPLGKYRVRLIRNQKKPQERPTLDIREYVSTETFEGFTRRGVRLAERAQLLILRETIDTILGQEDWQ